MIKHDYNPYDATKANYFELRNLKYNKMPLLLDKRLFELYV